MLARLLAIPLVLLGVVSILFAIFQLVPGDAASFAAGPTATQAEVVAMRARLGLDQPVIWQYVDYVGGLARGDFGFSTVYRGNPLAAITARIPATLELMAAAIGLTVLLGVPAGVLAGARQDSWLDHAVSAVVVALLAIPNFWLGLVLMSLFSVRLRWLPSFGDAGLASLVLPASALAARLVAIVARTTRGLMIEEMRRDYVRTARAKGLIERAVVVRHVLRNVLIPLVTVIGLQAGYLLGGSVVIERLFAWPGVGDLMLAGVSARDATLVQGAALFFVLGFLLVNVAVEFAYRAIDPRMRHAP